MHLTPAFQAYLAAWVTLCAVAIIICFFDGSIRSQARSYAQYMMSAWKIGLFIPSAAFVTFAGRFAYDDTWDVITGAGMSVLTFVTAPWAFGSLYLVLHGKRPIRHGLVAVIACLFSSSWFYDGWLLWRDGYYSPMWLPNLLVSPFLYCAAGVLWNLEVDSSGRATLGFVREDWPRPPKTKQTSLSLAISTLPPIVLVGCVLMFSVKWKY